MNAKAYIDKIRDALFRLLFFCIFDLPFVLKFVVFGGGSRYSVGPCKRMMITYKIIRNNYKIPSLSTYYQHMIMADEILRLPKSLQGDVVECGCFNGSSTANLSLACALTNRRLFVCDSFKGLPTPNKNEKLDFHVEARDYYSWNQGEFSSIGGLEGVFENVRRFGCIEVCRFINGYFKETLKELPTKKIVLVFEDADLSSSVEDCIRYLWPKLQEGCRFYCHEPWSIKVVALFYDKQWWHKNIGTDPPGFYGSGNGIKIGLRYMKMGYATKFDPDKFVQFAKQRVHLGSKGYSGIGHEVAADNFQEADTS